MVDLLSQFLFQPVLHNWCNKGCGMYYPVWDWAYKRYLAANQKVTHEVVAAGFLLSPSHVILHLGTAGWVGFFSISNMQQ